MARDTKLVELKEQLGVKESVEGVTNLDECPLAAIGHRNKCESFFYGPGRAQMQHYNYGPLNEATVVKGTNGAFFKPVDIGIPSKPAVYKIQSKLDACAAIKYTGKPEDAEPPWVLRVIPHGSPAWREAPSSE